MTAAFFPSVIGGGGVTAAVDAIKGKKLPKWTVAPVIGVTTKLANDWLAGKSLAAGRAQGRHPAAAQERQGRQVLVGNWTERSTAPAPSASPVARPRRRTDDDRDDAIDARRRPATPCGEQSALRARASSAPPARCARSGTLVALAGIWIYFSLESEYFFTEANIWNIFLRSANIGIIAAGLTVVMIAAEIDLSIGSLEALSGSVAAVVIINHGYSIYLGIAAGLGATVLCGAISGLLTWKLKVVSFISTLAMLGIAQGAAFLLTNGQAVAGFGETYDKIGTFTVRGFPGAAIIADRRLRRPAPDADADEVRPEDLRGRRERRGGGVRGHQPGPREALHADDQRLLRRASPGSSSARGSTRATASSARTTCCRRSPRS